jgi:prevent-host-death family protein
MMRVEWADATGSLSEYARKARKEPVVVTRRGKPVAVLQSVTDEDWENLVVSSHPTFIRLMERSYERYKPGMGIPLEEIEREFGLQPKAGRRRAAKPLRKGR